MSDFPKSKYRSYSVTAFSLRIQPIPSDNSAFRHRPAKKCHQNSVDIFVYSYFCSFEDFIQFHQLNIDVNKLPSSRASSANHGTCRARQPRPGTPEAETRYAWVRGEPARLSRGPTRAAADASAATQPHFSSLTEPTIWHL